MENKTNYIQQANRLGLFFITLFIVCFLWFYFRTAEKELHEQLIRLTFLGFSGMNLWGFILGVIQSYFWGYIFVGIWQGISKLSGLNK